MRSTSRLLLSASLAILSVACGSSIEVRTMASPDASVSQLRTFRMLPGPARRDGQLLTGDDDPMISNSIANRAIRQRIVKAFQDRGYVLADAGADFVVAFYASAREKLDVAAWDYGYPAAPGWPTYPRQSQTVVQYLEGSVVVDVVKPGTRQLLWRGEGRATLSNDPTDNVAQLAKAAEAIVAQFPATTARFVAER